jgi:hypothetical protein
MTGSASSLHSFVYGEYLEGVPPRSLGYRLLMPSEPEPWSDEVESLARHLQAVRYPDHWSPVDLFASVLLATGERLVAVVRYDLADHTANRRGGGLELVGVVAPGNLDGASALAVYHRLRRCRKPADILHAFGGSLSVNDLAASAQHPSTPPNRFWREGRLLFAATAPDDPDAHLGLLEQETGTEWQWLPLIGGDFPLETYARRGSIVAWTMHATGHALHHETAAASTRQRAQGRRRMIALVLGTVLAFLLAANLWATLVRRSPAPPPQLDQSPPVPAVSDEPARERFAEGMYHFLQGQQAFEGWQPDQLLEEYHLRAATDDRLRVANRESQLAVGAVAELAARTPARLEALVREALSNKGYDPELVNLVCRRVHERITKER